MEKLGIRTERLQLEWVSSAEGSRFAELIHRLETLRKGVNSEEIAQTIDILKDQGGTRTKKDENPSKPL